MTGEMGEEGWPVAGNVQCGCEGRGRQGMTGRDEVVRDRRAGTSRRKESTLAG